MEAITLKLNHISTVKAGDVCYDKLLKQFFVAIERQLPELKKRDASFWVVADSEKLFKEVNISNR